MDELIQVLKRFDSIETVIAELEHFDRENTLEDLVDYLNDDAERCFSEIFADILFFSSKSLSEEGIITDCAPEEISVRRAMIKNAARRVFLCDSEKIGSRSAFKQCELSEVDDLICEKEVPRQLLEKLRRR